MNERINYVISNVDPQCQNKITLPQRVNTFVSIFQLINILHLLKEGTWEESTSILLSPEISPFPKRFLYTLTLRNNIYHICVINVHTE